MSEESGKRIPLVLVDMDSVPIHLANHFLIQHTQDEFVLTVGQMTPPPLLGTEEERREQLEAIDYVPVKIVARLGFTRARLAELIEALRTNLDRFDAQHHSGV